MERSTVRSLDAFRSRTSPIDVALNSAAPIVAAQSLCQASLQILCVFVSKAPQWRAIVIDLRGTGSESVLHTADSMTALGRLVESQLAPQRAAPIYNMFVRAGLQLFADQGLSASWGSSEVEKKSETGGLIVGIGWRNRLRQEGAFAAVDLALKRIFEPRISHKGLSLGSDLPSRGTASWAISSELRAGYRSNFGGGRISLSPQLALLFDSYRYRDLQSAGSSLRIFAPTTSIVLAPGIDLQFHVSDTISLGTKLSFGVFSAVLEAPSGYGESGPPSVGSGRVHLSWRFTSHWEVEAAASLLGHSSEFSGVGNVNLTPVPEDTDIVFLDARLDLSLFRRL